MKSLEIVNEKIEWCHECDTPAIAIGLDGLQQIKESLEVLEIIKNKRVDIELLKLCSGLVGVYTVEHWLDRYNSTLRNNDRKLTLEELLKLKQWLEENE